MSNLVDIQSQIQKLKEESNAQILILEKQAADKINALQAAADEIKAAAFNTILAEVVGKIKAHGITINDLRAAGVMAARGRKPGSVDGVKVAKVAKAPKKSKDPVPAKYKDGENSWSGRGLKPRWLTAALAAGKTLDSFLVTTPPPAK